MSKRNSGLPRIPRDLYQSPPEAVAPLLPFLEKGTRFVEPCAGDGHLIRALEAAGHYCVAASDVHPLNPDYGTLDARLLPKPPPGVVICTNPPWDRPLLHELIVHFSDMAPTFLIFDADWLHTHKAKPYLPRLRKVISVGRVRWIFEGSTKPGFDNVAVYNFGQPRAENVPLFYGRGVKPVDIGSRPQRICPDCGVLIDRFGKWRLRNRNGVPAPTHVDCANPSGRDHTEIETPLLDWRPPHA